MRSWRIEFKEKQPEGSILIALWHEHLPICIRAFGYQGFGVLISQSQDGQLAAAICQSWGYHVFRGSSSKGALIGSKNLVKWIRDKQNQGSPVLVGMVLDGPRGPYHSEGKGVAWLASHFDLPVFQPVIHISSGFRLKSWDKTLIPWPFAKVYLTLKPKTMP